MIEGFLIKSVHIAEAAGLASVALAWLSLSEISHLSEIFDQERFGRYFEEGPVEVQWSTFGGRRVPEFPKPPWRRS